MSSKNKKNRHFILWLRIWPAVPFLIVAVSSIFSIVVAIVIAAFLFHLPGAAVWCTVGAAISGNKGDHFASILNGITGVVSLIPVILLEAGVIHFRFHI